MRFLDALVEAKKNDKKNVVIPDIKCFSPKEGDLMRGRNPVDYALALQEAGAPVVSVVTEEKEFHGSLQILRDIAEAVKVPILRKDFIHTREDLIETKAAGASAILLMCSCLEKDEIKYLYEQALEIGLDPFVETHTKDDFVLVKELGAYLVGINNRDILVLERDDGDVSNTLSLASLAPEDAFLVTESSIKNPSQVRAAIAAGADAALVGTAILNAEYTDTFYKMMCSKVSVKICGLMNAEDIRKCVSLGVDRIGLVVEYPLQVPWNLSVDEAAQLRREIPEGYQACMVTGGSIEEIMSRCNTVKPDMVQLHYRENFEQTKAIAKACKDSKIGVIKTVPMSEETCIEQFGTADVTKALSMLADTLVEEVLVDPRHGSDIASKNLKLDVELAKKIICHSSKGVILAGGLGIDNVAEIISETGCTAVDIMNGSENAPGDKSSDKISSILEQINSSKI